MNYCLVESDVALCPLRVGICAYRTDIVILVEEYLGLAYYCCEDNVLGKSVCLLCTEHTCADDSQVLILGCCVLDVDELCFACNRKALSLGNDEDRSLDLKTVGEFIVDDGPVL